MLDKSLLLYFYQDFLPLSLSEISLAVMVNNIKEALARSDLRQFEE